MTALTEMTMAQLVARYNELADSPVKLFRNKAQGIAAIQELEPEESPEAWPEEFTATEEPEDEPSPAPGLLTAMVAQVVAEPTEEPEVVRIPLGDICTELQIVPRIARRRLRKALGTLEEGRWEFLPEQVDGIKALITGVAATE